MKGVCRFSRVSLSRRIASLTHTKYNKKQNSFNLAWLLKNEIGGKISWLDVTFPLGGRVK